MMKFQIYEFIGDGWDEMGMLTNVDRSAPAFLPNRKFLLSTVVYINTDPVDYQVENRQGIVTSHPLIKYHENSLILMGV